MSLSGQLRITVIAAVTLTILLAQFVVATYEIVANYVQSRDDVTRVSTAIFQHDEELGSSDILADVQAHSSVIAATLQLPTGEVLWTFDRNAPDPNAVVSFDSAPPLTADRVAWYDRNRLDADLQQKLTFVSQPVPLTASLPGQLGLLIATPSAWRMAQRHLLQTPFILVFGWVLALLAARRLSRQVVEPLAQLVQATHFEGQQEQVQGTGRAAR